MHVCTLLHTHLKKSLTGLNQATLRRLVNVSSTLLTGSANLSLTELGRYLSGGAKVKNKIKAIDRLLGHEQLYSQRASIYQALCDLTLSASQEVDIIIDWSACGNREQQLLRASYYHASRSIVLYEEVHKESSSVHRSQIEKRFLHRLKKRLPESLKVTIISDAGFKGNFFFTFNPWDGIF